MRAGRLNTPTDILYLGPDLHVYTLDWVWTNITAKDATDAPMATGLRSPAKVEVRAWWDARLLQGRYLRAEGRLLYLDGVRDVTGQRAELVMTATELVGEQGEFRPLDGVPLACRVHLTFDAPYRDDMGQTTEYRTRAEVALVEVGRAQPDDQLLVGGQIYNVIAYADESDDGIVRGLWLDPVG
ncbi:hypothetical protein [uncultured Stutzerimonas sp.]|uniref:hypothetical protein n=1 Tax=uncultured Stutzerimonas sp. TaxID=2901168 RepID=UPI0032B15CDE|tara:strand:- start:1607 stop:2158 length:552 start_codon:yes stop_codon:yes gene_type:complete